MKKRNAFTLIELLAVIVILAVILVIAIPRILDVIETSKKDSFKNAAQLIADSAEKKKVSDKLLGKDEEITCKDVAKINDEDYASCIISFDSEGNAKVNITGKGKFDGFNLDGGMARNTYIDPLIEDNVDKVLIISTRHNFELPQKVMQKIDSNKVIIISPKAEIDNKDLLNFSPEFCSKLYKEGYEMGLEFDLNLLQT